MWNKVEPFLTSKGFFTYENITIENKGKLISDNLKLTEIFNILYINIVKIHPLFLLELQGSLITR